MNILRDNNHNLRLNPGIDILAGFIPYGKLIANFWAFDLAIADAQKRNPSGDNRHTADI